MLQNISRQKDVKGREAAVSDEEIEMGDEMERTTERKVESARQTINSSTFAKTFTAPKYVVSLCFPEETLFFALKSERNDGHNYLPEPHCNNGMRCSRYIAWHETHPVLQ